MTWLEGELEGGDLKVAVEGMSARLTIELDQH